MNVTQISSYQNCNPPVKSDCCDCNKKIAQTSETSPKFFKDNCECKDCFVKSNESYLGSPNPNQYFHVMYCSGGGTN